MLKENIQIARGQKKAEILLKNASFVNVFTGQIEEENIAIAHGKIVGIGAQYQAEREIDVKGYILTPGLIDAHIHLESTQLVPTEFARLVLAQGTTAVVADPHEIANVCGVDGIQFLYQSLQNTALDFKLMFPSCVPATIFETNGAILDGKICESEIAKSYLAGLGEVMNLPAVLSGDADMLQKLQAAHVLGKIIDGHAPQVTGLDLNAYLVAGVRTDHECSTLEEAAEKVKKGMYILMREGSAAQDVAALCKAITPYTRSRFLFCTDDKHAEDIAHIGHINHALAVAVQAGMSPIDAVICATYNSANCYQFQNKGAIAIGYDADIAVFDNLTNFQCKMTFKAGKIVAQDGHCTVKFDRAPIDKVAASIHLEKVEAENFQIQCKSGQARCIQIFPKTLFTEEKVVQVQASLDGKDIVLPERINKIAVLERHKNTGNIGLGLVSGFGIQNAAIAMTIAHDSHNCIVVGDNNIDMATAVNCLREVGGGIAIVSANIMEVLPLEIAGLMTEIAAEKYILKMETLLKLAKSLGIAQDIEPFMTLSFLALPVIPKLKMTDKGLFDVINFCHCPLEKE